MLGTLVKQQIPKFIKNKKLMIAIGAILFIPILYAGMFLWAFWDPYERLDNIPVAIVNEDEGYYYEGEFLTIGNELVDKLKEEDAFDFHSVDFEEGMKGLEQQDYYVLIEIPENFSKNATTVLDDEPQKVEFKYVPNESYNFLAAQIGETAMLQIEQVLEENIIEAYAETIFEKVDEISEGLMEAEEATVQLNDGARNLKNGSERLRVNLETLASRMVEFKEGVGTAYQGTVDLVEGAGLISSGVSELYDHSKKLHQASEDLMDGSNQLTVGIGEVQNGIGEMRKSTPQLIAGTDQLYEGLYEFSRQLPLQMSKEIRSQVEEGSEMILQGTDQLQSGIVRGLKEELAPKLSTGLTIGLSEGISQGVVQQANQLLIDAPTNISGKLVDEVSQFIMPFAEEKAEEIIQLLEQSNLPDEELQEIQQKVGKIVFDFNQLEQKMQENMEVTIATFLKDLELTEAEQRKIASYIQAQIEKDLQSSVEDAIDQTVKSVNNGFYAYKSAITSSLDEATKNLDTQISQALEEPIGQLQYGMLQLKEGQMALQDGVQLLAIGTGELLEGGETLSSGQQEYVANMKRFTSGFKHARNGMDELASGTETLQDGVGRLDEGATQMSDGTDQLYEGSNKLSDGMQTLVDGTDKFNEEMSHAVDEINEVEHSHKTYEMISNPVKVANEKIHEVPNYGTGFAPYFLSLGLFVGALLLSIVYPLREPTVPPSSGFQWFFSKFTGLAIIGILQAVIASGVLLFSLKLQVKSVPLFICFTILTSLTFISLIQFFVTCFDNPGRFIAILILILQLTTSAGTFPLELIPEVLQPLNAILPMTYTVFGFKAVISSGDFSMMWTNVFILLGFITVFIVGTVIYFNMQFRKKYESTYISEEVVNV